MERQETCSSEMGHPTKLRWRSNDSFFHVRGDPNEKGSVWTLEICPIIYQSCYREEEMKARLLVVELFLESIVSQNRSKIKA